MWRKKKDKSKTMLTRIGFNQTMADLRVLFRLVDDVVLTDDERWAILHGIVALRDIYNATRDEDKLEPLIVCTVVGEEKFGNG